VVVTGRYRGVARDDRSSLDAAFAHVVTVRGGRIAAPRRITDTRCRELPPAT
jgi:ketosteroid isomerase-like protein